MAISEETKNELLLTITDLTQGMIEGKYSEEELDYILFQLLGFFADQGIIDYNKFVMREYRKRKERKMQDKGIDESKLDESTKERLYRHFKPKGKMLNESVRRVANKSTTIRFDQVLIRMNEERQKYSIPTEIITVLEMTNKLLPSQETKIKKLYFESKDFEQSVKQVIKDIDVLKDIDLNIKQLNRSFKSLEERRNYHLGK